MPIETLQDLMTIQVSTLFSAEVQVSRAWPRLAKRAWSNRLANTLWDLHAETEGRIGRLELVAEALNVFPNGRLCQAVDSMLAETEARLTDGGTPLVIDAWLIANAVTVECYKATLYGSSKSLATVAGMSGVEGLLDASLLEQRAAIRRLEALAEAQVHPAALLAEMIDGTGPA